MRLPVWSGLDAWRAEVAEVEFEGGGLTARGTQIGIEPVRYRADYRLDASADGFVTRALRVDVVAEGWQRRLRLERGDDGEWTAEVDGEGEADLPAPGGDVGELAEAFDCDLAFSPLTNTMPIRRHGMHEREGRESFLMAWVSLPDLSLHASRQHYVHVRTDGDGAVVRYESESRDFVAELEVDPEGLMRLYPQLARRV